MWTLAELHGAEFWVAPGGSDLDVGSREQPFASLAHARDVARGLPGEPVTVWLAAGKHRLRETLVFGPEDSRDPSAPLVISGAPGAAAILSGGMRLRLDWRPFRDGIYRADLPEGFTTDQLFVDGRRLWMARYPNLDASAQYFSGTAADCVSAERAARWKDPRGGFFHAMHRAHWGDMHWRITGRDADGVLTMEGGWQNNRPSAAHGEHRFVENIFEELDAPGEWYLDESTSSLFLYPPEACDLSTALVESVRLEQLVELRGSRERPVRSIALRNLTLTHTARTFMKNREPLLRSDWTVWRGGAIYLEDVEDCRLEGLTIREVGSNAIFVSGRARRVEVVDCHVTDAGASSISFVGRSEALRSPLFRYEETDTFEAMDSTPGPRSDEYPAGCLVENCLLTRNGRFEKQTAGVNICTAEEITVRRTTIHDVPRAAINVSNGALGGHLIEDCDVFDTVKETGDHGSFNSWGRDRFWHPDRSVTEAWLARAPDMARWDARKTTVIRHNRWRCDLGWDIDLDDGSSNYRIVDNLCLSGGIKLREGYHRLVENNVLVNNTFHPHVWYRESDTGFRRNIVFAPYAPAGMKREAYGESIDENFLHLDGEDTESAEALRAISGADAASLAGDAQFVDAASGDYRVGPGSPALSLGFRNFSMDAFGVVSDRLRRLAGRPILPGSPEEALIVNRGWGQSKVLSPHKKSRKTRWLGALVRNVQTEGDRSAAGLDSVRGVLVLELDPGGEARRLGLKVGDVILEIGETRVDDVGALLRGHEAAGASRAFSLGVWRQQQSLRLVEGARTSSRQAESLGRGLVAVKRPADGSVFVSWRLLADDPEGITFDVLRSTEGEPGKRVNVEPIANATCLVDRGADLERGLSYTVRAIVGGEAHEDSPSSRAWDEGFLEIPVVPIEGYRPGDASVGDLDGDGELEIVLHQTRDARDNSHAGITGSPILDAYELDGTHLWRIDLGRNIREGEHYTQFLVYDLDGDGLAEVACKTADGTVDGVGQAIGDREKDWRTLDETSKSFGRVLAGPEFLTVFDGRSGAAVTTVPYSPGREPIDGWGGIGGNGGNDSYGNRCDRFLACVAYLDGERPSLIMCRGVYGRTVLVAWDFRDAVLTKRWVFDSGVSQPPYSDASKYSGMGGHSLGVADVDGDGRDEIVYQAMVIDDDGTGLHSSGLRHGDAMHVGDLDPSRPGLEIFTVQENEDATVRFRTPGAAMRDARSGEILWSHSPGVDVGAGLAADIDPRHPGCEAWGGPGGLRTAKGEPIGPAPRTTGWAIWWDGDLLRELWSARGVTKWRFEEGREERLLTLPRARGGRNPCLLGDLLGDWREEFLVASPDGKSLRLHTTTIPTMVRIVTLLDDPQYRLAIAWQNVVYNKPPHPGFFLGEGMKTPPQASLRRVEAVRSR